MGTVISFLIRLGDRSACVAAPVEKCLVDMTYTFDESTQKWPTSEKFEMKIILEHTDEVPWSQSEDYSSGTHVGTHFDAPRHFAEQGWTVEQIPLDRLMAPAAVIDITRKAETNTDYEVQVEDLLEWERKTGQVLNKCVVLIRSAWGKRWHDKELFTGTAGNSVLDLHFPGVSASASQWLIENRQIYGIGTDTLSFDNGPSTKFESHRILLGQNIYGLENVANMEKIPIQGATLYVMPMKIGGSGGAPCRIVATFPKTSPCE